MRATVIQQRSTDPRSADWCRSARSALEVLRSEPRRTRPPAAKKGAPDPPNAAEAAAILNEAWRTPAWGALLWTVMVTGCRRGELCALRWSDVDLERGKVTIDSALTRKLQEKSTKSEPDRRISIDAYTVELLRAHKARAAEQCKVAGMTLRPTAYVFSLEPDSSKPIRPDTVTQRYRRSGTWQRRTQLGEGGVEPMTFSLRGGPNRRIRSLQALSSTRSPPPDSKFLMRIRPFVPRVVPRTLTSGLATRCRSRARPR